MYIVIIECWFFFAAVFVMKKNYLLEIEKAPHSFPILRYISLMGVHTNNSNYCTSSFNTSFTFAALPEMNEGGDDSSCLGTVSQDGLSSGCQWQRGKKGKSIKD